MAFLRIKFAGGKFFVVLFNISNAGFFQQIVPVVHLYTQGIERMHNLLCICNNGVFFARQLGKKMPFDFFINTQLYFFRIYQHKF